jgi:hypothetical protein
MSEETIRLLEFAWTIISSVAAGAWVVVPAFCKYVRPRLQEWRYARLKPSQQGARDLERLADSLGQMRFLLRSDSEIMRAIQEELYRTQQKILAEASCYTAIHSDDDEERCSALRFLSQVEGEESVRRAIEIITIVARDRAASDEMRGVAQASVKELEERGMICASQVQIRNVEQELNQSASEPAAQGIADQTTGTEPSLSEGTT